MTPAEMEVFSPEQAKWIKIGEVGPKDPPGSFSDNKSGRRDVYLLYCLPDDSATILCRSKAGADVELGERGEMRAIESLGLEVVREIKKGESYEMRVKTDRGTEADIKITHK